MRTSARSTKRKVDIEDKGKSTNPKKTIVVVNLNLKKMTQIQLLLTLKMKLNSKYRQSQITAGNWTTSQIIAEYPRFRDYPLLVFYDFLTAYTKAESFEENFLGKFAPLIMSAAEKGNIAIPDTDDECLKLLILLLKLVPNLQRVKAMSKDVIIERVICFIKANDDILEVNKEHKPHLILSPFICCVGSIQHPASFSVVSEGEVIHAGQTSIEAFKTLYASFHIFRIPYPSLFSTFSIF
ncbi:hypothetical protein DAPPUDRAFT_119676 [Daphnia pulex]|uniref:Uncharacterized protein n=1 Tax=Daphnia pulex TaxID=6669 RepID=E9HZ66_DAPPU|nr:hypothetical protein DAPPUDRAFT_119676 [Daphnia pulex]|eukprot:EFX62964.1 hypothetical protein DAPPUDRAFT_119676 [Daphnia pulex]